MTEQLHPGVSKQLSKRHDATKARKFPASWGRIPTWAPMIMALFRERSPSLLALLAPLRDPCARSTGAQTRRGGAMPRTTASRAMAGLGAKRSHKELPFLRVWLSQGLMTQLLLGM